VSVASLVYELVVNLVALMVSHSVASLEWPSDGYWGILTVVLSAVRLASLLAALTVSYWVERKGNDSVDQKEPQKVDSMEHESVA
jgi:hypothetical protein